MFLNVPKVRGKKAPSVRPREQTKVGLDLGGSSAAGGGQWFVHPGHRCLMVETNPKRDKRPCHTVNWWLL